MAVSERATFLSPAMVAELERCADSTGTPMEIKQRSVADALVARNFILHTNPNEHPSYARTYFITPAGRRALAIIQKQMGRKVI